MAVSDYTPAVDTTEVARVALIIATVGGAVVLAVVLTLLSVVVAAGVY